jgi:cytochrome b6-f complex iron-sulfur subunit
VTSETETRTAENGQDTTDAWRQALATRRTQLAEAEPVPIAAASRPVPDASRRRFILGAFWAGLGTMLAGSLGIFLDFFYPRGVTGFGGPVAAGKVSEIPKGGPPKEFPIGQFWLVNLDPAEARPGGSGGGNGLLALWRKCPHLGCSVPWRGGFSYEGDQGWFRCPCHGSTYTKAGVRVFGPAPRSMDTMAIEIDGAGNITVQTGQRTPGGVDNPQRAIPL